MPDWARFAAAAARNKMKIFALATLAIAVTSFGIARLNPQPSADIVDTAVASKQFPTLVAAVQAAGLVEALKGKGPFTVFAPTEEAFKKLEAANPGITASLLKPENKHKLADILKFHVVSGKVLAADVIKLKNGTKVKTLNGKSFKVSNSHGVKVGNAKVIKTDILATNGVIHVIDTVLIPK